MTEKKTAREINEMIDYTCWAVFNRASGMPEDHADLVNEADEPWQIVDLMRQMRDSQARLNVRNEYPFHFGHRIEVGQIAGVLI